MALRGVEMESGGDEMGVESRHLSYYRPTPAPLSPALARISPHSRPPNAPLSPRSRPALARPSLAPPRRRAAPPIAPLSLRCRLAVAPLSPLTRAVAGRQRAVPPGASRGAPRSRPAPLSPGGGRYRPRCRPRWHQPNPAAAVPSPVSSPPSPPPNPGSFPGVMLSGDSCGGRGPRSDGSPTATSPLPARRATSRSPHATPAPPRRRLLRGRPGRPSRAGLHPHRPPLRGAPRPPRLACPTPTAGSNLNTGTTSGAAPLRRETTHEPPQPFSRDGGWPLLQVPGARTPCPWLH
nr:vegetative cell wall protein gp1-like [Lolium perenne]